MAGSTPDARRQALTLTLTVLVIFSCLGLARFGFAMVLPAMQQALALTNTQTGQLQSWNSMGYLLVVAFAGALAARRGPRLVIAAALGLTGLAMIGTGVFPSFAAAGLGRFLAGAGGAAANVPAMALLAAWFSPRRRGLAAGVAVSGSSLGLAATGAGVPLLLAAFGPGGWRACWIVFGAVTLAVCALCAALLRDSPDGGARRPAVAAGGGWRAVYTSRALWQVAAVYFAFGFSYSIFSTFYVKHLVAHAGLSTARAGAVWSQIGLASVVSGFLWGGFSDRFGRRAALTAVFALQAAAFLAAGTAAGLPAAVVSGLLFAVTAWSIPAVVAALCGDAFGPVLAPAALGCVTVVFGLGQVLGPVAGGLIADRTASFAPAFVAAGLMALLPGAAGSLALRIPAERPHPAARRP